MAEQVSSQTSPHTDLATPVLALLRADNRRDAVRYGRPLSPTFSAVELDGSTVLTPEAEVTVAAQRWAARPDELVELTSLDVVDRLVIARYQRRAGLTEGPAAAAVYEVEDGQIQRAWRYDVAYEPLSADPPAGSPSRLRGVVAKIALVATFIAAWLWDELVFSVPIIALAAWAGPWVSFLAFSTAFTLVGTSLSVWLVSRSRRDGEPEPNRLAMFLTKDALDRRWSWLRRLIQGGSMLAFALSSFLLGGIVTTWITWRLRPTMPIHRVAVVSNILWATTFVGTYAGIAALIF